MLRVKCIKRYKNNNNTNKYKQFKMLNEGGTPIHVKHFSFYFN